MHKSQVVVLSDLLSNFLKLGKLRLASLVVFSGAFGFILGNKGDFPIVNFLMFSLAGLLITTASNALNQIIEIDTDALMDRTKNRPLVTRMLSIQQAVYFVLFCFGFSSFLFLRYTNISTFLLALASLLLYAFAYTPLKTRHPIAVFVGAIPGALPPMIGWVAATDDFGWEPGILFAIQFIWQFPHFWAIAWVLDEDYHKAGIRLLPGKGKDLNTAFQIMVYTLLLLPLGFAPYLLKMTNITSAIVALLCGVSFLVVTFIHMKEQSREAALKIMFASFIYLPIVQIAFLVDKL